MLFHRQRTIKFVSLDLTSPRLPSQLHAVPSSTPGSFLSNERHGNLPKPDELLTWTLSFSFVYFDDILIFSKSKSEQEKLLNQVLQILKNNQFHGKSSKCLFFQDRI